MPFIHGKNAKVIHGAYDLSAFLNDGGVSAAVETNETTTYGATGGSKTYITGLNDGGVQASGLFDGSANAVDVVLEASIGSDTLAPVTFAPNGLALGERVKILLAKTTSYEVSSPVNDVVNVSYQAQSDGGVQHGVSLVNLASVTATADGTAVDNSASSANGGVGQLHVTANTRSANVVVKIQHSTDNSTWVDLITFTTVATTVTTSERSAVTGTVNRYLRVQYTLSAGTGAITLQSSFARR
jgi:hypothetical protein